MKSPFFAAIILAAGHGPCETECFTPEYAEDGNGPSSSLPPAGATQAEIPGANDAIPKDHFRPFTEV